MFKKLIYFYYLKKLKKEVLRRKIPRHIGIILDGNRRYAEKYGLCNISEGHTEGADKLKDVLKWCMEIGIHFVTVWAFSTDNFKRDKNEIDLLFGIMKSRLESYINSDFINSSGIKIKVIGKRELLPEDLLQTINNLEEKTSSYSNLTVYIAIGYGGRQEICDALINFVSDNFSDLNKLDMDKKNGEFIEVNHDNGLSDIITVESISKYLYVKDAPDPDLIIRTSGEIRLSGFLLWQSAYSEFYFCDAYWPEFREIDFLRALRSYQLRNIRHGR